MKLWLISQRANGGYDTYDSAVVAAETEEDAKATHPDGRRFDPTCPRGWQGLYGTWANPSDVAAEYIGETDREAGVICASFNAG